jgi:hypothetical protein
LQAIAGAGAGFDAEVDRAVAAQEWRSFEPPAGDVEDDLTAAGERQPLRGDDQAGREDMLIGADQNLAFPLDAFALEFAPGLTTRSPGVGDWSLLVRRRRHHGSPQNWRRRMPKARDGGDWLRRGTRGEQPGDCRYKCTYTLARWSIPV